MKRRAFTKSLAGASLSVLARGVSAADTRDARFLLVFLRGGYDAANLLVPASSAFYYESRPHIAVPPPGPDNNAALPIDAHWALHPALRPHIWPLFQAGQVAFIPFAGTDDMSRSHFETQDSIELGQPVQGHRNYQSGFLNRLSGVLQGRSTIAFTDQLPLSCRGDVSIANMALTRLAKPGLDQRQMQIIASMYQHTPLAPSIAQGETVRDDVMRDMTAEMDMASRNANTAQGFELEARRMAEVMRDRYAIGFVDVGGWDTHVGEGAATGYLANRLDELGRGLNTFATTMGPRWQDTVVLVISEFGRTFRENGSKGTDHGHGSVYWVLGGAVKGGRVAGEQTEVNAASLFQNRDYPVLNDYRGIAGGLLKRLFGLNASQSDAVFPTARPVDLGLL